VGDQEIRFFAFEDFPEVSKIAGQRIFANIDVEATERHVAMKARRSADPTIQSYDRVPQSWAKMICDGDKPGLCAAGIEGRKNVEEERDHGISRIFFTVTSSARLATKPKADLGILFDYYYTNFYAQTAQKRATMCICLPILQIRGACAAGVHAQQQDRPSVYR